MSNDVEHQPAGDRHQIHDRIARVGGADRGTTGKLTASGYSGSVSARSANSGIATVSVSGNVVAVKGVAAGIRPSCRSRTAR